MSLLLARPRGRPRVLTLAEVRYARRARLAGVSVSELARQLHCGRATIRRALGDT
jgi:DNA invertase Pin-like site-specific DNA recombinase